MRLLTRVSAVLAIVAAIGLVTTPAYADLTNDRPIVGADLTSLQQIFDDIYVEGGVNNAPISATGDQSEFGLFSGPGSGASSTTFIIELAGNSATNQFGLYSFGDSSNRALIFDGVEDEGTQAFVTFLANGDIFLNFGLTDELLLASNFSNTFGFYLTDNSDSENPDTYFSLDADNANGQAQALIYQGDGDMVIQIDPFAPGTFGIDNWIIAWEDLLNTSGGNVGGNEPDFNDLVVIVESVFPVPVPGAMLLGALGLGIVGWARRRLS